MKNRIVWLSIMFSLAFAQVPNTISFQGYVTDAEGQELAAGSYYVEFGIYDAETEGSLYWTDSYWVAIAEGNGLISVLLGSDENPISLPEDGEAYLEISMQNEVVGSRSLITSVAYSMKSGAADTASYTINIPENYIQEIETLGQSTDSIFTLIESNIIDSIFVYDTLVVRDSLHIFTYDTTVVYDSTFVFSFDTTIVYDTLNIFTYDTTTVYDTLNIFTYDTTVVYDSTFVFSFDTTIVYDTLNIFTYDTTTVYDTLNIFTYDTTVVYDTTYINVDSSAYADTASYSTKADTANYAKNVHTIEFPDTIIFNSTVTYPNAWGSTDFSDWMELDLSSIIGNRRAFITLEIYGSDLSEENTVNGIFRPKSNDSNIITGELSAIHPGGANIFRMGSISGEQGTVHSIVSLVTDNNGKIEWEVGTSDGITTNIWTIKLLCYQY
jgi:hypothetical protein